jgi:hypothetical protein
MKHAMLDLETMGLSPDGVICAIGAVKFDPFGDELSDPFYVVVEMDGQEKYGRRFTGSTVTWWLQQEDAARRELYRGDRIPLPAALEQFQWWMGPASMPTWAYGATFDHSILQSAYGAVGLKNPIHYRDQFCMRPYARLTKVECPHVPGTTHNAVDDATRQARWLQAILRKP